MASISSLLMPQPDDTMDMSSPGRQHHDQEDIEIDLDDYANGRTSFDDDMLDENEQNVINRFSGDAEMDEEFIGDVGVVPEAEMVDHLDTELHDGMADASAHDEDDLIDYDEDEWAIENSTADAGPNATALGEAVLSTVGQQKLMQDHSPEPVEVELKEDQSLAADALVPPSLESSPKDPYNPNARSSESPLEKVTEAQSDRAIHVESSERARIESDKADTGAGETGKVYEQENEKLPAAIATAMIKSGEEQIKTPTTNIKHGTEVMSPVGHGTPTDTGLHPILIRYDSLELPLFKSRAQPSGLLEDDNLCNVSLAELMEQCKTGLKALAQEETFSDKEIVLSFESLPLTNLTENARAAFERSLHDILEVYLELHRNDTTLEIPPFVLTLSLQYKFTSSLQLFAHMAKTGVGYTSIPGVPSAGINHEQHEEYQAANEPEHEEAENHIASGETHPYDGNVVEDSAEENGDASVEAEVKHETSTLVSTALDRSVNEVEEEEEALDNQVEELTEPENGTLESAPHGEEAQTSAESISDRRNSERQSISVLDRVASPEGATNVVSSMSVLSHDDHGTQDEETQTNDASAEVPEDDAWGEDYEEDLDREYQLDLCFLNDSLTPAAADSYDSYDASLAVGKVEPTVLLVDEHAEPPVAHDENDAINQDVHAEAEVDDTAQSSHLDAVSVNFDEDDYYDEEANFENGDFDEEHDDIPFDDETAAEQVPFTSHEATPVSVVAHTQPSHPEEADSDEKEEEVTHSIDEDIIDFDDDTTEQHLARVKTQDFAVANVHSPASKRSFADHAYDNDDELNLGIEPEVKKARAQ